MPRTPGQNDDVLAARAVNAEPWAPPGMVKKRCPECRYFFAADPNSIEPRCPDCAGLGSRPGLP